jgi:hypothetical protein
MVDANTFTAVVELFPQDKGWHYVRVPVVLSEPLLHFADRGLIAVNATVGALTWPTSLLPMGDNTYFIALPAKIRKKYGLVVGDNIDVAFSVRTRR